MWHITAERLVLQPKYTGLHQLGEIIIVGSSLKFLARRPRLNIDMEWIV
jgi:hypothetical protein